MDPLLLSLTTSHFHFSKTSEPTNAFCPTQNQLKMNHSLINTYPHFSHQHLTVSPNCKNLTLPVAVVSGELLVECSQTVEGS